VSLKITSEGAERVLNYMVGAITTTETLFLKLYSNNVTPSSITEIADLVEVSGGNYTQKTLTPSDWDVQGNVATSTSQVFTFNAAVGNIYGYYLVGQTTGQLIAAERFTSGPFNVVNPGDSITVTATISVA
jgi:hypothetical protein